MDLLGFHHVTAVTARAAANHAFYTGVLGLRLVKKTVNQDDVSAYHLFYADGLASPGTDLTFFDWPVPRERHGTHSIVRTGLRVRGEAVLPWWRERLRQAGVFVGEVHDRDGRLVLDFEDPEGQRLSLVVDRGGGAGNPWARSVVPAELQILGLGPVMISVPQLRATDATLTRVMNMRRVREYATRTAPVRTICGRIRLGRPAATTRMSARMVNCARSRVFAWQMHTVASRCISSPSFAGRGSMMAQASSLPWVWKAA